ncbi:family 78 glycoside hydrolase catalytic domain [Murimonas intestini]|uniref:alpha-L-rhamnosidase-related protein n=1 Tax=Murimonas intestini TaxID=1337051 RepID=UPI0011DDD074|nr:family 78 glycoside hydrolase catalytic domain [Murimonas intestini]
METADLFRKARPVWAEGREKEMNMTMGFVLKFQGQGKDLILRLTGSTIYRVFLNGVFLLHGPARAAHGYYRVDEVRIGQDEQQEENWLAVETAGFNVNSYYTLDAPSFLQAELSSPDQVIGATVAEDTAAAFIPMVLTERIQKVQRYSFQRPFIEAYRLEEEMQGWRTGLPCPGCRILPVQNLAVQGEKKLLLKGLPDWKYKVCGESRKIGEGTFFIKAAHIEYWPDRALLEIGDKLKGYEADKLEICVSREMDRTVTGKLCRTEDKRETLSKGEFEIYDLGRNTTGFIKLQAQCTEDSKLYIVFDEVLTDGDVRYNRMSCVNTICLHLKSGHYDFESFQPYTCRYIKIMAAEGRCRVERPQIRELRNHTGDHAVFHSSDEQLNRIFEAARETYAQNALDVYMDCPSRERAGWLCDSFFTARVEADLTGRTVVEDAFLENFLLPEEFAYLPDGMLPMCYPSDHYDGNFIPNWALWLVLELYEYRMRKPEECMTAKFRRKIEKLFQYFEKFENEDGLLEDLDGWIFVEWSRANELTEGVNYPSNMLYSAALRAAGSMYGEEEWVGKGRRLADKIREQSFDGKFFRDQAVRLEKEGQGRLVVLPESTEVCQYYAFFFMTADKDSYPELFQCLIQDFGPDRNTDTVWKEVGAANAFIGNYLRVELLSRYGLVGQILEETKEFFDYMVLRTGTLWENTTAHASCNHGFASHVIHSYLRDLCGISEVDRQNHIISFRLSDTGLEQCECRIPVGGQWLYAGITAENGRRILRVRLPEGFTASIKDESFRPCEVIYLDQD